MNNNKCPTELISTERFICSSIAESVSSFVGDSIWGNIWHNVWNNTRDFIEAEMMERIENENNE